VSHRPYPNVDRALAQVYRHAPTAPAIPLPDCLHQAVAPFARMRVNAQRAAEDGFGVDEYRLSTRPRVVGGGS